MHVNFYNISKRRNSTLQPSGTPVHEYTGYLRAESGVLNPTIRFEFSNNTAVPEVNYAYISEFHRYYWVTEITAIGNGLFDFSFTVDVLASARLDIGLANKYVLRSSAAYDGSLIDSKYPIKVDPLEPTAVSVPLLTGGDPWSGTFMVGVITPYGTAGGITIYALNETEFQYLKSQVMTNDNFWSNITDVDLKNLAICISDPLQYIAWCRYYPFQLPAGSTTSTTMTLGKVQIPNMPMLNANMTLWEFGVSGGISIAKHPQSPLRGEWLNSEPYSNYYLEWEPIGMVQIPSNRLHGLSSVQMRVKIDMLSGMGKLILYPNSQQGGNIIYSTSFMVGCDVPLSQIMSSNPIGLLSTTVGVLGAAGSLVSGNIPGAISGGASAVGSYLDAISPSVRSLNGSRGTLLASSEYLHLISVFNRLADDDNAEFGRPLCQVRQLNQIPGFIQCQDGEIAAPFTEPELREIESYLTGGFFYE